MEYQKINLLDNTPVKGVTQMAKLNLRPQC